MLNLLVWNSEKHRETVQTCRELDIQIVAYSPIGQGLLTDDLTDDKFSNIRAANMTGVQIADLDLLRQEIRRLGLKHGRTMSQVVINWVKGHGAVPLIGCQNVEQVEDAVGSLEWVLPIGEISKLDDLSLGLSLFELPLYRRCMFVLFISMLQLAYYVEQRYYSLKNWWQSIGQKHEHSE
jgi:pyridoxine 4-dehydrogenase